MKRAFIFNRVITKKILVALSLCLVFAVMAAAANFAPKSNMAESASSNVLISANAESENIMVARNGALNLTGSVSYVNTENTTVSASSSSNITNTNEGWAWYRNGTTVDGKEYTGIVLVLYGAQIDGGSSNGITVPAGTTIVSKYGTTSNIRSANFATGGAAAAIFAASGTVTFDGKGLINAVSYAKSDGSNGVTVTGSGAIVVNGGLINATGTRGCSGLAAQVVTVNGGTIVATGATDIQAGNAKTGNGIWCDGSASATINLNGGMVTGRIPAEGTGKAISAPPNVSSNVIQELNNANVNGYITSTYRQRDYKIPITINDGTSVTDSEVDYGAQFDEPASPAQREGYVFDGWYQDSDLTERWDFPITIVQPIILYESWMTKQYEYTVSESGGSFSVAGSAAGDVSYSVAENTNISNAINAIRSDADGHNCTIIFGDGSSALNIGTGYVEFSNSAASWGAITLQGKITSANTAVTCGTILVSSAITINSTADIANTGSGNAIYNNSTGALNLSGGTVSAAGGDAIYNGSTGAIVLSGSPSIAGTINSQANKLTFASGFAHAGNIAITLSGTLSDGDIVIIGVTNLSGYAGKVSITNTASGKVYRLALGTGGNANNMLLKIYTTVARPSISATSFVYNGSARTVATSGTGYTVSQNSYINADGYTLLITLASGYLWSTVNADGADNDVISVSWSITPATITLTRVGTLTKVYDGNTSYSIALVPDTNYTIDGLVNDDTVAISFSSVTFNNANVASATSVMANYGAISSNYYLTAGSLTFTATITRAVLTVTATAQTVTYGSSISQTAYGITGYKNEETVGVIVGLPALTASRTTAGSGTISVSVSAMRADNYGFTAGTNAALTINRAAGSVAFPTASGITYGATLSTSALTGGSTNGSFTWENGTVKPAVNNSGFSVVFTPADTDNFDFSGLDGWNGTTQKIARTVSVNVAKANQNAPAISLAASTPDSIALGQIAGAEYSMDGDAWQNSNIFGGLDANTGYTFYIRLKSTANLNMSEYTTGEFSTLPAPSPIQTEETHEITGRVEDAINNPVAGAFVYIIVGRNFFGSAVTDSQGNFTISNLPDGVYNVVALYEGKTATVAVTVSGGNIDVTIQIHDLNVSSKLEVKEGAPDVVVDGLDRVAGEEDFLTDEEKNILDTDGGSAELKLTVEASGTQITASDGKTIGFVVDITVTKTILDTSGEIVRSYNLPTLSGLISVIIPLGETFRGKQNYIVYRMHGDELQIITTVPNIDGEYFVLTEDGKFIVLYTQNFSAYAVGFDEEAGGGAASGDCFVHWIMLALMLVYIAYAFILYMVFEKKNQLVQYIGWGVYVLGIIIIACFMKWDALCVVFFILAVLTALAALIFWLITFNPTVKEWVEKIKQKFKKQEKEEQTAEAVIIDEPYTHIEQNSADEESAEYDDIAELLALVEEEELTETEIAEIIGSEESGATADDTQSNAGAEEQAAESGEIIIDEETRQILAEAAIERQAFVEAKKAGAAAVVPELRFTLSREDVIDYVDDMAENSERFPVTPKLTQKSKKHYCDTLYCGQWCFGLMYERSSVIKFTLRMDGEFAAEIDKNHTAFKVALFPKGEAWYDLVVDSSFGSKREVFDILDKCYDFVLARYYREENQKYITDTAAAKADAETVAEEVKDNAKTQDPAFDLAIAEREEALLKFRAKNQLSFKMTRKRMLLYANSNKELTSGGGVAIEREKRYTPASLKIKGKTYAMIYEKAYKKKSSDGSEIIKTYVSLTVRISDTYADWLALRHPEVCRARFPKNRNWYIVPVDGSFPNAQMVYRVLKRAKKFVTK